MISALGVAYFENSLKICASLLYFGRLIFQMTKILQHYYFQRGIFTVLFSILLLIYLNCLDQNIFNMV